MLTERIFTTSAPTQTQAVEQARRWMSELTRAGTIGSERRMLLGGIKLVRHLGADQWLIKFSVVEGSRQPGGR